MNLFVEIADAAGRLEELIDLVFREDEVVICRAGQAVAAIEPLVRKDHGTIDDVRALAARGTPASNDRTSNHDEFHDENGLRK